MPTPEKKRLQDKISREQKKRIAKDMIKGYKKMADLNLELAEEGLKASDEIDGETGK